MTTKTGKAYAFFNCGSSKEKIEEELPFTRKCVKTPGELELSLIDDISSLKGDSQLLQIAEESKEAGINYVMEATYPNATNHKTADELASILNQAYQSPLYEDGETFIGEIFYKLNGEYVSRE
ncbi:hypothetical protein HYT23_01380 [Candidatus Pacearchaeota archaeon]|nr:hypothetical protein [Candidatus Pacearchaeota archaeon]